MLTHAGALPSIAFALDAVLSAYAGGGSLRDRRAGGKDPFADFFKEGFGDSDAQAGGNAGGQAGGYACSESRGESE